MYLFARFAGRGYVDTRQSDVNSLTFNTDVWSEVDYGFGELDNGRSFVTTVVARDNLRAPIGLRGLDYNFAVATVLGDQGPGVPPIAVCRPGQNAVTVGASSVCFLGGVPVNDSGTPAAIDCGASSPSLPNKTDGACPPGYACQSATSGSFCTLNGFLPMMEERAPSIDGVIPARVEQQNEWPQMRHGYCTTGRELRVQTFTPLTYRFGSISAAQTTCTALVQY
jgi:hypothetical protein